MEVAVGAEVDEKTRVMRDFQVGVQRWEERVVEGGENLRLRVDGGEFRGAQGISIDDFEGEVGAVVVAEAAEEDAAEVAGSDEAEELEVADVESGESGGGLDGFPVGVVVGGVGTGMGVCEGGGGGGGETVVEAECEAGTGGEGAVGCGGGEAEVKV